MCFTQNCFIFLRLWIFRFFERAKSYELIFLFATRKTPNYKERYIGREKEKERERGGKGGENTMYRGPFPFIGAYCRVGYERRADHRSSVAPFLFRNDARARDAHLALRRVRAVGTRRLRVISEFLPVRSLPRHSVLCFAYIRQNKTVERALARSRAIHPGSRTRDAFPRSS